MFDSPHYPNKRDKSGCSGSWIKRLVDKKLTIDMASL